MAAACAVLAILIFANNAPPTEASITSDRLDAMNDFHDITWGAWGNQYDDLRTDPRYYWADWSQDGCSSPWWVPDVFTDDYPEACLRHDLTWRTLPVIDAGTGMVWNERNRYIADAKFLSDSLGACSHYYPWRSGSTYTTGLRARLRPGWRTMAYGMPMTMTFSAVRKLPWTRIRSSFSIRPTARSIAPPPPAGACRCST